MRETWPALDTHALERPAPSRSEIAAYAERHGVERARRLGLKATAYAVLSPLVRGILWLSTVGTGTAGVVRVLLGIIGGLTAFVASFLALFLLVVGAIAATVIPLLLVLEVLNWLGSGDTSTLENSLLLAPLAVIAWGILWWTSGQDIRRRRRDLRHGIRIEGLARDNALDHSRIGPPDRRPGMLFEVGVPVATEHRVRRTEDPTFEIARYTFDRSGDQRTRVLTTWGYAALRLPAPLPHIVLDARRPNGLLSTSLPGMWAPDADQRLGLEGDFDRHFTLYCPKGYEADALYLFTPDVMARVVDRAALYDIEIVDDWLFLYARTGLGGGDARSWRRADEALRALAEKIDRWGRWREAAPRRAPRDAAPNGAGRTAASKTGRVPEPRRPEPKRNGRRLTRKAPLGAILLALGMVAVAIGIVWNQAVELFRDIGRLIAWIGSLFG